MNDVWFNALEWCATNYLDQPELIPTGIATLDRVFVGGMRPGVYTLLGKPGDGKSALALHIVQNIVARGLGAAVVTLEMPPHDVWLRIASDYSSCTGKNVFPWSKASALGRYASEHAIENPLHGGDPIPSTAYDMKAFRLMIAEPPSPRIDDVGALLLQAKEDGAHVAVVDYLQMIDVQGVSREYERISAAMRAIAKIAADCRLPIILISSVNRDGLTTGVTMHGASGSSLIEYASVCVMTYRRAQDQSAAKSGTRAMELSVVKNRYGMITDAPIRLEYWPQYNRVIEV